jgi:hypothetical protein
MEVDQEQDGGAEMNNQEIATTIVSQFGRSFPKMVGLKQVVAIESGVQFGFSRGKQGINKAVITVNASDTYDLKFWRISRSMGATKQVEVEVGVQASQLAEVFESVTGMFTRI